VYVLSGRSKVRWGSRLEHEVDLEPGDFLYVAPFVAHQEINPSNDQPTEWIVVRSGGEAVIVHLTKAANGEYVADSANSSEPFAAEDDEFVADGAIASDAK